MSKHDDYYQRYQEKLAAIPAPGNGCHPKLLGVANLAKWVGRSDDEALEEIRAAIPPGNRTVFDSEILEALQKANQDFMSPAPNRPRLPRPLPLPRPRTAAEICAEVLKDEANAAELRRSLLEAGGGAVDPFGTDFQESSPVRIETYSDAYPYVADMITLLRHLYNPGDILFIGGPKDAEQVNLKTAAEWIVYFEENLARIGEQPSECRQSEYEKLSARFPLIMPNPHTGQPGPTKSGDKESWRADSCISEYRYIVAEFDEMPFDEQGAMLRALCKAGAKIAAVIYSGGKSFHAWLRCEGVTTAEEWQRQVKDELFPVLVAAGVDRACSNPSRLSRLPGMFRSDKGNWQRLLYLAPEGGTTTPEQLANNIVAMCSTVAEKVNAEVAAKKIDGRALTSPVNGQAGGRPFVRPEALAQAFLRDRYTFSGFLTLRRYRGTWLEWRGDYWHERANGDIRAAVSGYVQDCGVGTMEKLSKHMIDNVLEMLNADSVCALDSLRYQIPCFLPGGENATGWMPMKNAVIDIEAAAAAMGQGAPIPPEAQRDPSPELFTTYGLDYDFDPTAQCPKFLKYLSEVQPCEENRECLQMLAGLALVPDCRYNVAFFLFGEAGTGKSVFVEVLTSLVGSVNCCSVPLASLANRFGKAPLTEKLLNIVGDLPVMPESGNTNSTEGFFKQITSGDLIPVERKGVDAYKAPAIARMVFAANSMPHFSDRSLGIWDRLRIIPFDQRIRGTEKQNPNLAAEIIDTELPGVLNWALIGLAKLRKLKQFPECPAGAALKEEHRLSCDHEQEFLVEHVAAEVGGVLGTQLLYNRYRDWAKNNGYRPVGAANFKNAVMRVFPGTFVERRRIGGGQNTCYVNIMLKGDLRSGVPLVPVNVPLVPEAIPVNVPLVREEAPVPEAVQLVQGDLFAPMETYSFGF